MVDETTVQVVSAAVVREDAGVRRVLLAQRRAGGSYPLTWCTPGGKAEAGETLVEALHRELGEELDLCVPARAVPGPWWARLRDAWSVLFTYEGASTTTGRPFTLTCFTVEDDGRFVDLAPGDGVVGLGWFTAGEVRALNLAAADHTCRELLVQLLERR